MDDLISRQEAIGMFQSLKEQIFSFDISLPDVPEYIEHHNRMKTLMKMCDWRIEFLSVLPSEPRWIPVTERLPEERVAVLVYEKNYRNSYTAYYESAHGGWMKFGANIAERFGEHLNIVAWMPLPEPYGDEEDGTTA